MNEEEAIEMYKELKKYKEIIGNIEPNFNTNLENWTITINLDYYNCLEEYIRRILDELEQKDKEIQFQKEINKTEQNRHKQTEKSLKGQLKKKDKIIDEIQKEVRDHIGFENRLKRDNKEPDLFNQGRFYVANNINNILKGK